MKQIIYIIIFFSVNAPSYCQDLMSLPEAINYALEHHSSLKVSELESENAKWQYKEALSIGMPNIKGNINYTYYYKRPVTPTEDFISPAIYGVLFQEQVIQPRELGDPETFEFSFVRKNDLSLSLSGEVLAFDGNFLKGLKAAKMFIDLANKQIELTKQDIVHNVTRAYQAVLVAERNKSIIQSNINNITTSLEEAEIIYANGFIEELDVDRLKLSLANLNIEKEKLKQVIDISYNVLKYQMAFPLERGLIVSDQLETTVEKMIIDPIEYMEEIDPAKRPEHNILVDAIALDHADLARIKQGYIPSISAVVGYGQSLQRDNLFSSTESGFLSNGTIGLRARIPIYDGGFTKSKIQQKKIEIDKRNIELKEFDRAMKLQVTNAYRNFENAKLSLDAAKKVLELNEKIFDKAQIKYNEGVGSSVELTQAESSLYQSQAQYINALYDLLTTKTEIDIATGEILKYSN